MAPGYIPNELIKMVGRYLSKRDLKSMRLASKTFKELLSEYLFTRVYASVHRADLNALRGISNHPEYRKYVQEIVYTGVYFRRAQLPDPTQPLPQFLSEEQHRQNCEIYRTCLDEQEETMKTGEHLAIITSALIRRYVS
ncbi:hypothetical protein GGS26DRAFT_102388 [Hypomontagnella submonticulosa]|nr:hypothetical protein GGS26DRAFT_102388 [Hypomontagnella submonticulosa]